MRVAAIPSKLLLGALIAGAIGLLAMLLVGVSLTVVNLTGLALLAVLLLLATLDYFRSWRIWADSTPQLDRLLPAAFAVGVRTSLPLRLSIGSQESGTSDWSVNLFDRADPTLATEGLPIALQIDAGPTRKEIELAYFVAPTRRGEVTLSPADVRIRSRWRLLDLLGRVGVEETRRVFPDFAQVARYAWLAGDRRLAEIGIKTYQQRGEGTDFKQLSEYRVGDSVRHIDWKATLRQNKPILREFQDERDQCVMLLLDCGRRMRAYDAEENLGGGHFDQVLNASLLLTYV